MTSTHSADDMYGRVFPGEKWTITFEATGEQATAMTAHVDAHTADADERLMFLQMLGLAEYESAQNMTGRDAWAKRVTDFHLGNDIECGRGHQRGVYGFIDNSGRRRCRECNRQYNVAKRERKKAAA